MAKNGLTWVYLGDLTKSKDDKGNTIVQGVATDPSIDADDQIVDLVWARKAMDGWFKSGANLRLMHERRAIGKGIEMEWDGDQCLLKSKVVDKGAADLVDEDVLTGYSIGIRNARVIKDAKAKGGRICGGVIPEVSLVDRPANYNALLVKGLGVNTLDPQWQEEDDPDLITVLKVLDIVKADGNGQEPDEDEDGDFECSDCCDEAWLSPGVPCPSCNADGAKEEKAAATDEFGWSKADKADWTDLQKAMYPSVVKKAYTLKERLALAKEGKAMPGGGYPIDNVADLENAIRAIGRAKDPAATKAFIKRRAAALKATDKIPDTWKMRKSFEEMLDVLKGTPSFTGTIAKGSDADTWLHDPNVCSTVVAGISEMLKTEIDEQVAGEDERWDIQQLMSSLDMFLSWQQDEAREGETQSPFGQGDDMDALITMGLDADLVKVAKATEATPEDVVKLRKASLAALGLDEIVADYEAVRALLAKSATAGNTPLTLAQEIAALREMASPADHVYVGPARTDPAANKGSEVVRLTEDLLKYRRQAASVSDPSTAAVYHQLANETYDQLVALGASVPSQ